MHGSIDTSSRWDLPCFLHSFFLPKTHTLYDLDNWPVVIYLLPVQYPWCLCSLVITLLESQNGTTLRDLTGDVYITFGWPNVYVCIGMCMNRTYVCREGGLLYFNYNMLSKHKRTNLSLRQNRWLNFTCSVYKGMVYLRSLSPLCFLLLFSYFPELKSITLVWYVKFLLIDYK